jgi:hypothetical protein
VLDHVHREGDGRVAVDRRGKSREQRGKTEKEEPRAPDRPVPPHPRNADHVNDGGERGRD